MKHRTISLLAIIVATMFLAPHLDARSETKSGASLIHYWSFNDGVTYLTPTQSIGGASIEVALGIDTEVTTATGQDFFGENNRIGEATGSHLRINNPLGAAVDIDIPTTGYGDVVVQYETRRSGSGAGEQWVYYTLNGSSYTFLTTVLPANDPPVLQTFDFSSQSAVNDNPNFGLRILFEEGSGGSVGNNRFDNFSVDATPLVGTNLPPTVVQTLDQAFLISGGAAVSIDVSNVFDDDDPLTLTASSDRPSIATVNLVGDNLNITPVGQGEALITLEADDGVNPAVSTTVVALVYPEAHALKDGPFFFGAWNPDLPENTYPEHMLFLQSDQDDPELTTPLDFAYFIPPGEYASGDSGTIGFPYNNTSRTRLNGLNDDGISLINTGRGRDLGGVLVALDTSDVVNIDLSWLGGTILQNSRNYRLRVQYRIGISGPFQDLLIGGQPWEYQRSGDGHTQNFGPETLPASLEGQSYLQLLWRHYYVDGSSGPRAMLRLDDIAIEAVTQVFSVTSVGPTSVNRQVGDSVTFTVNASNGAGTVSYQWFTGTPAQKNAQAIVNENANTLTLNNLSVSDSNTYFCEVSDDFQTINSPIFSLNVVATLPLFSVATLGFILLLFAGAGSMLLRRRSISNP